LRVWADGEGQQKVLWNKQVIWFRRISHISVRALLTQLTSAGNREEKLGRQRLASRISATYFLAGTEREKDIMYLDTPMPLLFLSEQTHA
jgi:hypothetical protein